MQLTPHFSTDELGYDATPPQYQGNVLRVAALLEQLRAAAGVPLTVTSVYRSPEHNAEVGGVETSQHLTGSAADFVPEGLSPLDFYDRIRASGMGLPSWSQLELDEDNGHVHVGLPIAGRDVGEVLAVVGGDSTILQAGRSDPGASGILLLVAFGALVAAAQH